jgi:tetratricopeptide (TPR) repeat protein
VRHHDESTLMDYVAGSAPAAVADHVAKCDVCEHNIEELLDRLSNGTESPPPAAILERAQRILREDAEATAELSTLLRDPAGYTGQSTTGLLRALLRHIETELDRDPASALRLTAKAETLLGQIDAVQERGSTASLTGEIWKLRSHAQRMLSLYDRALASLDIAETYYPGSPVSDLDLASVAFSRAAIFADLHRYADAERQLVSAEPVFARYGERRRLLHVLLLRGAIAFRQGEMRSARSAWEAVLAAHGADEETLARTRHNLAQALMATGEMSAAADHLYAAARLYEELGKPTEAERARWVIGRVYLQMKDWSRALPLLVGAHQFFHGRDMLEEAGLAGLDAASAHLALRDFPSARSILRGVLDLFLARKLEHRAVEALQHLVETIESPHASEALQQLRASLDPEPLPPSPTRPRA